MRKHLAALAVATVLAVGAGTGTALAATSALRTTPPTPSPAVSVARGSMNAMHAQMIAQLPAAQRAVCDKMHNQMAGQTGMMSGHTGATASPGGAVRGGMMSGSAW
jgi:hypothetical protein